MNTTEIPSLWYQLFYHIVTKLYCKCNAYLFSLHLIILCQQQCFDNCFDFCYNCMFYLFIVFSILFIGNLPSGLVHSKLQHRNVEKLWRSHFVSINSGLSQKLSWAGSENTCHLHHRKHQAKTYIKHSLYIKNTRNQKLKSLDTNQ